MSCAIDFQKNITRWEEALPLGNGEMECLIWGNPSCLNFCLNRMDIQKRISLSGAEGREKVGRWLPTGKIELAFSEYENVFSHLELVSGQARLCLEKDGSDGAQIRSVVHAVKGIGMIAIDLPPAQVSVTLELNEELPGEPVLEEVTYGKECYIKILRKIIGEEVSCGVVMGVRDADGRTEIFYRVVTSWDRANRKDAADPYVRVQKNIYTWLRWGYDRLLGEHEAWWQDFWGRSGISLPDKELEKSWYMDKYLSAFPHDMGLMWKTGTFGEDRLEEMLFYNDAESIRIFPAIPAAWERQGQEVAFWRLQAEKSLLISASLKDGRLTRLLLESPCQTQVRLKGWNREGQRREEQVYGILLQQGENVFL